MLSTTEVKIMHTFREYGMTPNKMLCFFGEDLQHKSAALESLVDRDFLICEKFKGAYSLTDAGYARMLVRP